MLESGEAFPPFSGDYVVRQYVGVGRWLRRKDVTGATAAEEANNIAKQQIEEQKAALEEQKRQRIRTQQDRERQLSMAAKGTGAGGSTGGGVSAEEQLAGEFLGI